MAADNSTHDDHGDAEIPLMLEIDSLERELAELNLSQ